MHQPILQKYKGYFTIVACVVGGCEDELMFLLAVIIVLWRHGPAAAT